MKKEHNQGRISKGSLKKNTVENDILEALTDFTDALEKGEVRKRLTCRQVKLDLKPTIYNPQLVQKIRTELGVSQTLFAFFLGVSPKTVRSWEQGINPPNPMACRFMDEIRRMPMFWIKRLKGIAVTKKELEKTLG